MPSGGQTKHFKNAKHMCNLNFLVCLCIKVCVLHSWCFIDSPLHCGVLFSRSRLICRLYSQKTSFLPISHSFSMRVHLDPNTPKCDYFFYNHLDYSHPVPNFFGCSNTKYQQSHQISDHSEEAVIFKNILFKFFKSIWAEQPQRVNKDEQILLQMHCSSLVQVS